MPLRPISEGADAAAASATTDTRKQTDAHSEPAQWTTVVTHSHDGAASVAEAAPAMHALPLARTATAPESSSSHVSSAASSSSSSFDFSSGQRSLMAGGSSGASSLGRQLGLHASAAMGARQPSAPNTPASSPLTRGHGAPALSGAHSLSLPNSATRLRRPSVSLLTSAYELPDADAAMGRAQSASTSARGGLLSPAAAAAFAAAANLRSSGATTPNAVSTPASASASAHSAAASSSFASYALPSAAAASVSAAPAPAFARPDAMISYSRKDLPFVRLLTSAFEHSGRSVWVDWNDIPKAVDFMHAIKSGIRESNSFIYIISPDSVASKYCNLELDLALEFGKRIVPIVVREVSPDLIRPEIRAVNWIMCCGPPKSGPPLSVRGNAPSAAPAPVPPSAYLHDRFPHILASVLIDPSFVLLHTKLLVRALEWQESGEDASFLATGRELEEANKFMRKSRAYQLQQQREQQQVQRDGSGLIRRGPGGGGGGGGRTGSISAGSAVLLNAPAVTRIQKLFLFASNERCQATQKKEQMLLKFLEDVVDHDSETEEHQHETDSGADDPAAASPAENAGLEDGDAATTPDRGSSSRETSPPHGSGSDRRSSTTTTSVERFEHGSLSNRGSLSAAGADVTPPMSVLRKRFASTPSRDTPVPATTPMRRRSFVSSSGYGSAAAAAGLGRFSLHSSRSSQFYRGAGLRSVLAAQTELMSGFLAVVAAAEQDKVKEEAWKADQERAEQEARKRALEAAATAAVAGAGESAAAVPEWSPGSASAAAAAVAAAAVASASSASHAAPAAPSTSSGSSRPRLLFARLRFRLYTIHESLGFHLVFRALLACEAALVLCGLMLALGGGSSGVPPLFSRALRLLLFGSLASFVLEMVCFVLPIYGGWTRLKHQPVYLASLGLLLATGGMEVWSWRSGCAGSPIAVSPPACSIPLLVWPLLFRSWNVLLRGCHCLLLHPLVFSLSHLHANMLSSRALVSKLKHMLRLLNGEMLQSQENQTKWKWDKIKAAHPARRFSIAQHAGPGGAGLPGLPLPPPNMALNAAATGSAASPVSPTSRAAAAAKVRRSLPPTTTGGYATIPRASRGSAILPGAYGGAGGGVSSLMSSQAPRRSILMTSPSKHRGGAAGVGMLQDKYATMPALNSAAMASAAVTAAESSLANSPTAADEPLSASLPPPLPPSPLSASGTPSADAKDPSISVRVSPIHEPDIDVTPEPAAQPDSDDATTSAPLPPHVDTRRASDADQLPSPPPDMPAEDDDDDAESAQESDASSPTEDDDDDDDDEDDEEEDATAVTDESGMDDGDGATPAAAAEPARSNLQLTVSSPLQHQQLQQQRAPEVAATVAAGSTLQSPSALLPPPHPPTHVAASSVPALSASGCAPLSSSSSASSSTLCVLQLTSPPSAFSPRSIPTPPSDPLAVAAASASASVTPASAAAAESEPSPSASASTVAPPHNDETALASETADPPPPPVQPLPPSKAVNARTGSASSARGKRKSRRED